MYFYYCCNDNTSFFIEREKHMERKEVRSHMHLQGG